MRKLTEKEHICIAAYLRTGSKADAYRAAYSTQRMASSTVRRNATEVFQRGPVAEELDRLQTDLRAENPVTVAWVVEQFRQMADFNITDVVDADSDGVTLKCKLSELPENVQRQVKGVEATRYGVKVTFHDRKDALDRIARHLGMFSERHLIEMAGAGLNLNIYLDREEPPMTPAEISGIRVLVD